MVISPRTHPRIGFPAHGSIAVGTVTDGYLVDGARVPLVGPHHRVLPEQAARRTNYATDEMAALLEEAAARVAAEHPGAVLLIGNIAKGGGGDIPWSVSHNSGLDADLSFFLTPVTRDGPPVEPETLVHVDEAGRCVELPDCRIDVPRTWSLVAALLESEQAVVQWLFLSAPIREMLLEHARAIRAPRELIGRAAAVLHQPRGALPHDDHIHVRLYCDPSDRLDGCRDRGVERPERPNVDRALAERIDAIRRVLHGEDPERRVGALKLLAILQADEAARDVVAALDDPDRAVRAAALRAARTLELRSATPSIRGWLREEEDAIFRWNLLEALATIGGGTARDTLIDALRDDRAAHRGGPFARRPSSVRSRAAALLADQGASEAVGPLVESLSLWVASPDGTRFPHRARRALRLLTNHAFAAQSAADAATSWQRWWKRHRRGDRKRWLVRGFQEAGYSLRRLDRTGVDELLRAIWDERSWISRNARRSLARMARRGVGSDRWSRADAFQYWTRWCVRRYGPRRCAVD